MPAVQIARPKPAEYAPYFGTYVDKVPDGDVLTLLARQIEETVGALARLSEADAGFRYAPGKWSIREVVGHVADTERIFTYRALCFARGEKQSLPGFDENDYVAGAKFDARPLAERLAEFRSVRAATLSFFSGLDEEELLRRGVANQKEYTVRSVAFIIA